MVPVPNADFTSKVPRFAMDAVCVVLQLAFLDLDDLRTIQDSQFFQSLHTGRHILQCQVLLQIVMRAKDKGR